MLKIASLINKEKIRIEKIIGIGLDSANVRFEDIHEANRFLNRLYVVPEDVKQIEAKIRLNNTRVRGVISDWDMPIEELADAIDDTRGIISLERMTFKKFCKEEKAFKWSLGGNIIITMEGNKIPRQLSIFNNATSIKIRQYVEKVKQCYNCYRYGHFAQRCRDRTKICVICGEQAHGQCTKVEKCINCEKQHRADYNRCGMFL